MATPPSVRYLNAQKLQKSVPLQSLQSSFHKSSDTQSSATMKYLAILALFAAVVVAAPQRPPPSGSFTPPPPPATSAPPPPPPTGTPRPPPVTTRSF
ncbi:hypothetical protein BKA62DRAFT_770794 [Auriculariales sp. MPI-PUGE-AT-0066]|nr:hypothetical protein BKA62DRAFT_770794 [Auriculariales sp. MPI-PUGE-AT-0066]